MRDESASWEVYNAAQLARRPRPMCVRVLELAGPGRGRPAVDLGCGAGVEASAMAAAGWRVLAVDSDPTMPSNVLELTGPGSAVTPSVQDLQELRLPHDAALIHSSYALPFVRPAAFARAWQHVRAALAPGGWLAVTLFGERDSWAQDASMTFHSRLEVDDLLAGLDVVVLDEEDEDGPSFSGSKHWHVFHVIARRPGHGT